jgi:hypothetical protein
MSTPSRISQVREHAEHGAQPEQPLLGPDGRVRIGPLRPADRSEKHGVAVLAAVHGTVGEGITDSVYRRTADQLAAEFEAVTMARCDPLENGLPCGGDLGSDAVPLEHGDHGFHARVSSKVAMASDCCCR